MIFEVLKLFFKDYPKEYADKEYHNTKVASELIRWQDKVGSVEAGKFADIIATDINPLEDITAMQNVTFVMKGGSVVKQ